MNFMHIAVHKFLIYGDAVYSRRFERTKMPHREDAFLFKKSIYFYDTKVYTLRV